MKKFIKVMTIIALAALLATNALMLISCSKRVKQDTTYYIDTKKSSIMGSSTKVFLDPDSKIVLRKDGTATIFIKTSKALGGLLNFALSQGLASDFDLQPIIDGIVMDFLPGFTLEDSRLSLNLLKSTLNLSIVGLDPDDPSVTAIFDSIAATGKVPSNVTLPDGLGFEYNAEYRIKKVTSEYSGEYIGVFMGEQHKNGEPYVMMTLQNQTDSDKKQLYYRNEMLDITLIAKEK
jgi:hypothetical protein